MDRIDVSAQASSNPAAPFSLNSSIWEEWPELLQSVSVPYRFSASALGSPFRCPIRSFGKAGELHGAMGPGIPSLIGSAIHTLMQGGNLSRLEPLRERIESLEAVMKQYLERLPPAQRRGVLPLEGQYRAMAARSLAAASFWSGPTKTDGSEGRRDIPNRSGPFKAEQRQSSQLPRGNQSSCLIEEPLYSQRWRLEGRADLIRVESNSVEIVDFKTGCVFGEGGEILSGIVLQMQAYALMAAERWPVREIRLRVLGQEDVDVPNDARSRRRVEELLIELEAKFPSGRELSSAEAARPGPGCRYCRLRPICLSYLKRAAGEWARTMPRRERISTNDVWGRYLERDDNFGAILIEIPEGRKAKVFGLRSEEIDELIPGSLVGIFGCETQGQPAAGRAIHHPINWWIRRQGREVAGVRLFLRPG
jgi:hypothetical protein